MRSRLGLACLESDCNKRWELFAEYGFNFDDVHVVAAGLSFRF